MHFGHRKQALKNCRVLKKDIALAWAIILICFTAGRQSTAADGTAVIYGLSQAVALSAEDGAKALPVRGKALVTFFDGGRRMLFLQDAGTGLQVSGSDRLLSELELHVGQLVEYTGTTTRGRAHAGIRIQTVRAIGEQPLPRPVQLNPADPLKDKTDGRYVRVQGYIPKLVRYGDRLTLQLLLEPGVSIELYCSEGDTPEARDLAGAQVEATGVMSVRYDSSGKKSEGRIYATSPASVRVLRTVPLLPLAEVALKAALDQPVRMRGSVVNHNFGEFLVLRDPSGSLPVPFRELTYYNEGKQLEVFAWPVQRRPALVLTNIFVKALEADQAPEEPLAEILTPAVANTNLPLIISVEDIRKLSPQDASRGFPLHIRGVATYWDVNRYLHFVQDSSAGIYVDLSRLDPRPRVDAGQSIEIDGFTGPGDYAPIIVAQQVRVAGGGSLPMGQLVTLQKLLTGSYDSQWVTVHGVVRNQWLNSNVTTLGLFTGNGILKVNLPELGSQAAITNWVDASVEIQGVCTTTADDRRRLQGVELQVPAWSRVKVTKAPLVDPFSLPVKSISSLMQFEPGNGDPHRVRLVGIVTVQLRDRSFYLQDATGGLLIQPQGMTNLPAGQAVDVVGFPVLLDKQPVLQSAMLRPVHSTSALEPYELRPEAMLEENLYGTLVTFQGLVLSHFSRPNEEALSVQLGASVMDVTLDRAQSEDALADIVPGTVARFTGVYRPPLNEAGGPRGFQLLLRRLADVRVLQRPPWWTVRHTLFVLGAALALLVLGLCWVHVLRRKVRARTAELNAEIDHHKQTEARLEAQIVERKRMEAEIQRTHRELVKASREAGMAEVATSVLHNVGNVLNSVNVSTHVLKKRFQQSKITSLKRLAGLFQEHAGDLGGFLARDGKGRQLPGYIGQLAEHFSAEQKAILEEVDCLERNLEHIKQIISTQQSYARVMGLIESVNPADLVEDALRINEQSFTSHKVRVRREFGPNLPLVTLDKHKALQVIVNLIRNARNACDDSGREDKLVTVQIANGAGTLKLSVTDNGIGIAPENLTRIFHHGFTTRRDGHGFGLHSGALAAREMGGLLKVHSEGLGKGATFTLELPCTQPASSAAKE